MIMIKLCILKVYYEIVHKLGGEILRKRLHKDYDSNLIGKHLKVILYNNLV